MTDIFIFILAVATAAGIARYQERKKKTEGTPSEAREEADTRVYAILSMAYREMVGQHMMSCGPWIPAAMEKRCADPAVALTAVRWTIRDMEKIPIGEGVGYIPGLSFRFDLTGLKQAEKELEGMIGKCK